MIRHCSTPYRAGYGRQEWLWAAFAKVIQYGSNGPRPRLSPGRTPDIAQVPSVPVAPSQVAPVPVAPLPPMYQTGPVPGSISSGPGYTGLPIYGKPPAAFPTVSIRPREPPLFKGELNEDVLAWASSLRDYCHLLQTTHEQSVAYAATLMQGNARTWWDMYLTEHAGERPRTLEDLITTMQQRFQSPMYERAARVQLWSINQRKEEHVHAFAARFQNLLQRLPYFDEEDMRERFIRALNPALRMPVAQRDPQSLPEAIRLAEHLELLTVSYMGRGTGGGGSSSQQQQSSSGRGRQQSQGGQHQQQQQPNRGRGGGRRGRGQGRGRGRNDRSQVQCHRCGTFGHYASECSMQFVNRDRGTSSGQSGNQRAAHRGAGCGGAGYGQARVAAVAPVAEGQAQQQAPPPHQAAPAAPVQQQRQGNV